MQQTEITVQVFDTKENVLKKLYGLGFGLSENYQLNDWYFTKLDDIEKTNFQDLINNSILVREVVKDDKAYTQICYKKKYYDAQGNVTGEEKTKTNVDSRDKIISILTQAGLNNFCEIHNDSFCFAKDNLAFAVQVVDDLGIFIEYKEDDSIPKGLSNEDKIQYMLEIVKKLGFNIGEDYSCKKVLMKINQHKNNKNLSNV